MVKNGIGLFVCVTDEDVIAHDTLFYNTVTTLCSVRYAGPETEPQVNNWFGRASSLPEALQLARAAGLNPTACCVSWKG